jgi:SAM-dependent methyltransferase
MGRTVSSWSYRQTGLSGGLSGVAVSHVHLRAAQLICQASCTRVLDVGCGYGQLVDVLNRLGILTVGCDYINYGELVSGVADPWRQGKCVVADARMLPFSNHVFDGISLLGVLNYLSVGDIGVCLRECRRVLLAGGILVLRVGTPANRIGNFLRAVYYRRKMTETNYYAPDLYIRSIRAEGFHPVEMFYSLDTPLQPDLRTLAKYFGYWALRALWILARAT